MSSPLVERLVRDAESQQQRCRGCRHCLEVCPVLDESLVSAGGLMRAMEHPRAMTAVERQFAADCTLCGQCVPVCPAGARRDVMTHALKFIAFSNPQAAPRHGFPRDWWQGLRRDWRHFRQSDELGRLAPLLDREAIPSARNLLWLGCAAAGDPDLALSLMDFCARLDSAMEVAAGESLPSGRAWLTGRGERIEEEAARFLELCRRTGAEEVVCAEEFDAVFFTLVLEHCADPERPMVRVHMLSDWLAAQGERLRWRADLSHALFLPATLRFEDARRLPVRFPGDERVRNYSHTGRPRTLSEGHTAVDADSPRVSALPAMLLAHVRAEAHRVLVVETFSEALRLKAQARREGCVTVLLIHEALELVSAPAPAAALTEGGEQPAVAVAAWPYPGIPPLELPEEVESFLPEPEFLPEAPDAEQPEPSDDAERA